MIFADEEAVRDVAERVADAIGRRDVAALGSLLADGFVHRAHGGAAADRTRFLDAIAGIPGEIVFVRLESMAIDITPGGAMATGVQHARVIVDGTTIDDRRRFVDWFVEAPGGWRVQAAVDMPEAAAASECAWVEAVGV